MGREQLRVGRWTEATVEKTENGAHFPAAAYAYVPDPQSPSTWKLRLWETPELKATATQVGRAVAALSPTGFQGGTVQIPSDDLPKVKARVKAAWKSVHPDATADEIPTVLTEAVDQTFDEIRTMVQDAIEDALGCDQMPNAYVWIQDLTDSWAAYQADGTAEDDEGLWKVDYSIDDAGMVTLGTPVKVQVEYAPAPGGAVESVDHVSGRVLEAKGTAANGGRVFGVQIIEHGTSKNNRHYPATVLTEAAQLYDGAKAFDHHRSDAELSSSTIVGLVGSFRNVKANTRGLEGELHLLPSAVHVAEALDASLEAQSQGLPPVCGISHDVIATYRSATNGTNGHVQEATKIVRVLSADVVADPAAGGKAIRMVAGGIGDNDPTRKDTGMKLKELLDALRAETDAAKRAELLAANKDALDEWGLDESAIDRILTDAAGDAGAGGSGTGDAAGSAGTSASTATAGVGAGQEASHYERDSFVGRRLIRDVVEEAKLPGKAVEGITKQLGERFTETELTQAVEGARALLDDVMPGIERAGMAPRVGVADVSKDEHDKHIAALDKFFEGDFQNGFRSFKEAFFVISGYNPYRLPGGETDVNALIMRESIGNPLDMYDSSRRGGRVSESVTASTWNLVLGDSITRRLVAEYARANLDTWKSVVSSIVPINDFRTQRIDRVGGYGTLPTVAEGAPYQALTTPGNEEVSYSLSKRGGTEDLTLETIANDDVRFISRLPFRLGRSAARTLHNFVWDFIFTNPNCSYDSTALFAAGHSNTTAVALSTANMATLRAKMRQQTAYGDSLDILDVIAKTLIVPVQLEELGHELVTSQYAVPATTPGATNVDNLFRGMNLVVVPYDTDTNDWFMSADGADVPLIEVGFYQGRQDPELFAQTDPTTGAVFNADKITYKIRHIYSGAILDHRGFQRGTQ